MNNLSNTRKYGECLLGITRYTIGWWYTLLGSKGVLLDFMILNDGKRINLRKTI